jgi:hypothetical protein
MFFTKALRKKRSKRHLRAAYAIFLFLCYAQGIAHLDVLKPIFHSHEATVLHSSEQEEDVCHRTIYHNDKTVVCGHQSHIIASEKCKLCDFLFHSDQLTISASSTESVETESAVAHNFTSVLVTNPTHRLPARAPPFV